MKSKETQNFINSFKVLIQVITNYELEANIILKKDHRISYSEYIRLKQIRVDIEEKLKKLGGNIDYNKIIKQVRKEVIKDTSKFIIKELKHKIIGFKEDYENIDYINTYVIGEKCKYDFKEMRKVLEKEGEIDEEFPSFLDKTPSGNIIKNRKGAPGILEDYRQKSWGIDRICLDGIQNHLPEDSKGTSCYLQFLVGEKWMGVEEAKLHRYEIEKVRFADDGVGFVYDNLFYLHSTKSDEKGSVGQFGEGLKLVSMASVNQNLGMEIQSRNWIAQVKGEEVETVNTRKNDEKEILKRLIYEVEEYDGEPIKGSRTIFNTPTQEFIDYALELPELVMELGKVKPILVSEYGDIVDSEIGGKAYVKGIYLRDIKSIFSYNFNDAEVTPDRNDFNHFYYKGKINDIVSEEIKDFEMIKKMVYVLKECIEQSKNSKYMNYGFNSSFPIELGAYIELEYQLKKDSMTEVRANWKKAFQEVFGKYVDKNGNIKEKEAIIKTDFEIPKYLTKQIEQYNIIQLPKNWQEIFVISGVKTDKDIIPEYIEENMQTSLTINYGADIWEEQRIVLDGCQNHLPSDSGGTNVFLRFQTKDGQWYDYRKFSEFDNSEIKKIKICDDGIGFDYKNLGLLVSIKENSNSTGKWGEGLKMLAAATIRKGMQIEIRSRDWMAVPYLEKETLNKGEKNEKEIERVCFKIKTKIEKDSNVLNDFDKPEQNEYGYMKQYEKSSTTFINPTDELINEFRDIEKNILVFSNQKPVVTIGKKHIMSASGGNLYVKNILIPGEHQIKYSYHFEDFDIENRDRNIISSTSMKNEIKNVLENIDDERVISTFLTDAAAYAKMHKDILLEFETNFNIKPGSKQADTWIKVFKEYFGKETAIRSVEDQDFDAVHRAQHVGLNMVSLPRCVANALINLKGKNGEQILSYKSELDEMIRNINSVATGFLSKEEKNVLNMIEQFNNYLGLMTDGETPIKQIKVYDYPDNYFGKRCLGYAQPNSDTINISRDALQSGLIKAVDVFIHEAGHAITGAGDADADFRNFFTEFIARIIVNQSELSKSINDNGFVKDISISDVKKRFNLLEKFCKKKKEINEKEV